MPGEDDEVPEPDWVQEMAGTMSPMDRADVEALECIKTMISEEE